MTWRPRQPPTTQTQTALIESFDALRSGMQRPDRRPARAGPWRVRGRRATRRAAHSIYIWSPEVTTDSRRPDRAPVGASTRSAWSWADGRLEARRRLIAKVGGAAVDPVDPAGNPTAEEKHSILRRTPADPGEITDSADQSWFEYANAPH